MLAYVGLAGFGVIILGGVIFMFAKRSSDAEPIGTLMMFIGSFGVSLFFSIDIFSGFWARLGGVVAGTILLPLGLLMGIAPRKY